MSSRKHSHYFKDVSHLREVDVYRLLHLFGVTDQAIGHAIKKLLLAGQRGRKAELGQTFEKDIGEALDTLKRWQEMREEDARGPLPAADAPAVLQPCSCRANCKGPTPGQECQRFARPLTIGEC
jgi:hypothetical protein